MSQGKRWPHKEAWIHACDIIAKLAPYCELEEGEEAAGLAMIQIAGSLRRGRPDVGDIEIVAVPRRRKNLFGEPAPLQGWTDPVTQFLRANNVEMEKDGPRMKRFTYAGIPVDLHLVEDPKRWGWRLILSTGSGDFNRWLVTPRIKGGALPDNLQCFQGFLWIAEPGKWKYQAKTFTEESVFELYGLPFIPPEEREEGRWGMFVEKYRMAQAP